jgi:hypothetical protein
MAQGRESLHRVPSLGDNKQQEEKCLSITRQEFLSVTRLW